METIRYRTVDVYEQLCAWWVKHEFPPIPLDMLPFECFIISNDNIELYSIFMYVTDSSIAWLAWPIANPYTTKEQRSGALEQLMLDVEAYAYENSYRTMFTTSPLPTVQKALMNAGYNLGDENVNHYIKLM